MTIKRKEYPDINDSDPEVTENTKTVFPIRERVGIGAINPRGLAGSSDIIKTTIVGDKNV